MSLDIKFSDLAGLDAAIGYSRDAVIERISIDTRTLSRGDTYVAIRGEHFDGHDFIDEAIGKGAASIISAREVAVDVPVCVVPDTVVALGRIAALYRDACRGRFVAITGSNGKTTVKEMVAGICRQHMKVTATQGNLNNKIGVPLTVLSAHRDDDVIVVEMGTSERGEIGYLSRMVRPDIVVITNISESHLLGIGTKDDVFVEKMSIHEGLRPQGVSILNADDAYLSKVGAAGGDYQRLTYAVHVQADITCRCTLEEDASVVEALHGTAAFRYRLQVPGEHNVSNSLAALAVALQIGASHEAIVNGLQAWSGISGRMQIHRLYRDITLIDDTYNASPASVYSALKVLSNYKARKIFVFGGMSELGGQSGELHHAVGERASALGIDIFYAMGDSARQSYERFVGKKVYAESVEQLSEALMKEIRDRDVVLVKGSRYFRMERMVDQIMARGGS